MWGMSGKEHAVDQRETSSTTAPAAGPHPVVELDARDRAVLDFERDWTRHAGAKEEAIRQTFGLSATRYYQLLGSLLETREALAYDPLLVGRLLRLRETRAAARAARALPTGLPHRPTAR
ncbi:hypothetical protein DOU02_04255 [Clavibacter michiganensis subsp. michiganensis]|uniref:DUF3263 domain-containing protein n=1 Tax=Clavibacter michiganensis subsp. michiganensis TaxID=33013 RepID=A0A1Y3FCB3_CLAMM|nr:hypothetical protein DOU02_04255 [Clavibacter michiganensis subsp. michiganensis]OUD87084.1 hypothetical protein BC477_03755 [Clavibacter michiganensis subsp. michiganensis]OUD92095.1 hypothetical protein CMMCAS04_09685 [Clavibacter michiganensis subsp. michiganensis]OUE03827.1 hypothetical protein CMMCAS07_02690 [Clavibacter michiganensis subsp. michiganensis]OUE11125.1 hypothetical protein CMMCA001_14710 [Clavibacter michiganensis subsp. michiganensis]